PLYSNGEMEQGFGIATDASGNVYWSMRRFVKKNDVPTELWRSSADGTTQGSLVTLTDGAYGIAVADGLVYYSDSGAGTVSVLDPSTNDVHVLATGLNVPKDIVVDSTFVYWIESSGTFGEDAVQMVAR